MLDFDVWTMLASVVNILILFFFLKKFLFGRVNAILEKRQQLIEADLDKAKADAEDAASMKANYEQTLGNAQEEAKKIISNAEQTARVQGDAITDEAQHQADAMLEEAQRQIAAERQQTLDGVRNEVADLAMAAAQKLVNQKMDDAANRDLLDEFLKEEGETE